MNEKESRKNRIFFTLYCKYLNKLQIELACKKIKDRNGLNFSKTVSTVRFFSYELSDSDIILFNDYIESNVINARNQIITKMIELTVHFSDRHFQKKLIIALINAMNRFSNVTGVYFK